MKLFEVDPLAQGMQHAGRAVGAGTGTIAKAEHGLEAGAGGQKMQPTEIKALAPFLGALKAILADPKLEMQFRTLAQKAGHKI